MINVKNASLKRVLLLFAVGAVVALCTINVKIGMTDYNKTSTSLLTLEALADGEGSSSENSKPLHCPNFKSNTAYNVGTYNSKIYVTCCENGADIDACAFPYEDSRCAGKVIRNSHSHCQ
jgi:hypothetical protein